MKELKKRASTDLLDAKLIKWILFLICFLIVIFGVFYLKIPQKLNDLFPDFFGTKGNKTVDESIPLITCDRNKGEIAVRIDFESNTQSAWKCTCDSWSSKPYGYYSISGKPWTSFDPTCERYTKVQENQGIPKWLTDPSIDWSIIQGTPQAEEYGVCVIYYTTRALNDGLILDMQNKNKGNSFVPYSGSKGYRVKDLVGFYSNPDGYIEAVYEIAKFKGEYRMKRKDCSTVARSSYIPAYFYSIFYNDALDNLKKGNLDDIGFCVGFPVGKNEVVNVVPDSQRNNCQALADSDNGAKYSFFLTKKGNGSIKIEKEAKISIKYSVDYTAKNRTSDLTEEEVKSKCNKWESFDLTFIKGVKEPRKLTYAGKSEPRRRSACMAEIRYLTDNKLLEGDYNVDLKDAIELNDNERICCYANKI